MGDFSQNAIAAGQQDHRRADTAHRTPPDAGAVVLDAMLGGTPAESVPLHQKLLISMHYNVGNIKYLPTSKVLAILV
jgi:hypothetical protein